MRFIKKIKQLLNLKNRNEIKLLKGIDVDHINSDPSVSEEIRKTIEANNVESSELASIYEEEKRLISIIRLINNIPADELYELEDLATKYSEFLIRKNVYQNLLDKQEDDTMYLERYFKEIPKAIQRIEEYEIKQSAVKQDLNVLEGEKGEINYKKNSNFGAHSFTKVFMIFVVIMAALAALVFSTLSLIYGMDVLIPGLISITLVLMSMLWVSIFRRHLIYDIKKNQKLQARATELINKTRIKYVNNQSLLDYEYHKYRVNSSEMLKMRWDNYRDNIENEKEFNSIESEIFSTRGAINRLLLRNNIDQVANVIEYIDFFASEESRDKIYDQKIRKLNEISEKLELNKKQNNVLSKILDQYES